MTDSRQCSRCGTNVPTARELDPPHKCEHGVACTLRILDDCSACALKVYEHDERTRRLRADLTAKVRASLNEKPHPIASRLGAGIAAGPAGVIKKQ